jgi:AraC-like DNA-binding protein
MSAREPKPIDAATERRLAAGMAYIQKHFRKGPRLPEIAAAGDLSPFHFHRLFHHHYGKTPKQVLTELQIAEAQRLVLAGKPLPDVARRTGFAHQSHLTYRFKMFVGKTPDRWLRAAKAEGIARAA